MYYLHWSELNIARIQVKVTQWQANNTLIFFKLAHCFIHDEYTQMVRITISVETKPGACFQSLRE